MGRLRRPTRPGASGEGPSFGDCAAGSHWPAATGVTCRVWRCRVGPSGGDAGRMSRRKFAGTVAAQDLVRELRAKEPHRTDDRRLSLRGTPAIGRKGLQGRGGAPQPEVRKRAACHPFRPSGRSGHRDAADAQSIAQSVMRGGRGCSTGVGAGGCGAVFTGGVAVACLIVCSICVGRPPFWGGGSACRILRPGLVSSDLGHHSADSSDRPVTFDNVHFGPVIRAGLLDRQRSL